MKTSYLVLGAMAGSSMDGLDLALVQFTNLNPYKYILKNYDTIPYEADLYEHLKYADSKSVEEQERLDVVFGKWIAKAINGFLGEKKPDLLAVHGHTLIHSPQKGVSWQLGSGKHIALITSVPTVTTFRSLDIENGGEGAPLVPFGDFELFKRFDACLNLGGIANVSILENKTAWDICPCNQVLNYYSRLFGHEYDVGGTFAKSGSIDYTFLMKLEEINYFNASPPKSLPNAFIPPTLLETVEPLTGLRTYTEFIAMQITKDLAAIEPGKLLVTGGGAFNAFLVSRINHHLGKWDVTLAKDELISYKEALIFAFLGLKRIKGEINVLKSVTGARTDSSSGVIHLPE